MIQIKSKFCLIAISAVLLFGCKDKTEVQEISILSYNVAGLPEPFSGSSPDSNMSIISGLINEVDVVHVQEDFNYHDSLILYNTHPYTTPFMGTMTLGDGLNTFSNFPIRNFERTRWTDCADMDCFTPKGFSYSQLEISSDIVIDFYNVHMNAQSYEEALAARRKNTRQLCNYIKEHSANRPVIVFGDMNCRYTRLGDSIQNILSLGFKDPWVELIRGGVLPSNDGVSLSDCGSNGNERTSANCEKVDKVFYRSGDGIEISPISYKMDDIRYYWHGDGNKPLSDHWPLFVRFRIEKKK